MCPFGMIGVPASREENTLGALGAVTRPKQAPSLDIGHGETIKKRAHHIDLPKEGRRAHWTEPPPKRSRVFTRSARRLQTLVDFGDFGVSSASTVAGRYTRWGGPRLSVQGEPLVVLTRGP